MSDEDLEQDDLEAADEDGGVGRGGSVGHGEKQQIHMMLKILMPKAEFKGNDAADALAIAICHAHNRGGDRMRRLLAAG